MFDMRRTSGSQRWLRPVKLYHLLCSASASCELMADRTRHADVQEPSQLDAVLAENGSLHSQLAQLPQHHEGQQAAAQRMQQQLSFSSMPVRLFPVW